MNRLLPKGEFSRNVLTVMTGTTIAQAIPVAISPILTRLYTPADLGILALYVSITAIVVVLATGRYELAILLPRTEREAFDILAIAIGLAALMSALALLLIVACHHWIESQQIGATRLGLWLYVLPISVLLMAVYQSLVYWNNRQKSFKRLAASRVGQSATMCSAQICTGLAGFGASGLIAAYLLGQVAANGFVLCTTLAEARGHLAHYNWMRLWAVGRRHANFPKFIIPGQFANAVSGQMPVLMLSLLYGPYVAGFYSLAERVIVLPTSIIGSAIGDVYRQQAAINYQSTGNCRALYIQTVKKLGAIGVIPLVVAIGAGPWLFSLVFGPSWREAGEVTALLGAMVFFQIVSSPLSQTVLLARMQRLDMLWQIVRLALASGSIYLGYILSNSYRLSIALYAAAYSLLYLLHSLMQYIAACGSGPMLLSRSR